MDESKKKYFVGRPNIGTQTRFYDRLNKILERQWLTNDGDFVRELEQKLSDYLGVKHCVAMCNGTVALELAIRANEMTGKVLVPSMTFIATAHALKWQEVTPVFADIDPSSYNLCPKAVTQLIDNEVSGILGVHLYGRPCAIDALTEISQQYDLKLVFDAAHAFGASFKGQKLGGFGNCEVFSFHATKVFNTFEGGAVTTNDDELARKLRLMRNFGFEGEDRVSYIGTNGKMAEINAAMGLTNLEQIDQFIDVNRRNYLAYKDGLESVAGIELIAYDEEESNNFQYVIIRVDETVYGHSRDALKSFMSSHGVMVRRYFYPGCHKMEPYNSLYPEAALNLAETESFSRVVLALPTGTQISCEEVSEVCELISSFNSTQKFS